jgi:glutathione S-transferase
VKPPVLVTISFSHYCEKARWALDRAGIEYREEPYVPIVHLAGTLRRRGRSTPLLAFPDGKILGDSTDILRWVELEKPGTLLPDDPAERKAIDELEDLFDERLGPASRRIAYHALINSGAAFAPFIRQTMGGVQGALARPLGVVVPRLVRRALKIDEAGAARSRERLDEVFTKVESLLEDGRRWLVGDRFTAADLTFAALSAPVLAPAQQPVTSKVEQPAAYHAMCKEYRERPAGRFALRVYAEERAR